MTLIYYEWIEVIKNIRLSAKIVMINGSSSGWFFVKSFFSCPCFIDLVV